MLLLVLLGACALEDLAKYEPCDETYAVLEFTASAFIDGEEKESGWGGNIYFTYADGSEGRDTVSIEESSINFVLSADLADPLTVGWQEGDGSTLATTEVWLSGQNIVRCNFHTDVDSESGDLQYEDAIYAIQCISDTDECLRYSDYFP